MSDSPLSEEDKRLFREAVGALTPIRETRAQDFKKPLPIAKRSQMPIREREAPSVALSDFIVTSVDAEMPLFYTATSLPSQQVKKLRQGQYPIEARLDLHGMMVEEARGSLIRFIQTQQQAGRRCVLVIHGKGRTPIAPVLKNLVNRWLPQFIEVLAFSSACPQHGGRGAVYVLLR